MHDKQQGDDQTDYDADFNIPNDGKDEGQEHEREVYPCTHPSQESKQESFYRHKIHSQVNGCRLTSSNTQRHGASLPRAKRRPDKC